MRQIDVFISSRSFSEEDVRDNIVVVIDVLRACSSIHTALHNGCSGVIPVAENEDAGRYAGNLDSSSLLLCGEKNGRKVEGYHLGNSPLEYTSEIVKNKTIIMKTSNGTRAITRSHFAEKVLIASFLNVRTVARYLRNVNDRNIILVCSGWFSRLSIEDMLCAGALTWNIFDHKLPNSATDGVKVAFGLYEKYQNSIAQVIKSSNHARRLLDLGFERDIDYCSQQDLFETIPMLKEGMIILE